MCPIDYRKLTDTEIFPSTTSGIGPWSFFINLSRHVVINSIQMYTSDWKKQWYENNLLQQSEKKFQVNELYLNLLLWLTQSIYNIQHAGRQWLKTIVTRKGLRRRDTQLESIPFPFCRFDMPEVDLRETI